MRVLFVSGEMIAGDLPYRLSLEGCDVRLFIEHPDQRSCLNGFVTKTLDWRQELDWVGRDGLVVFDDVGYGEVQDALRKDGFRVFGGSAGGDRLELDREFAQTLFANQGLNVLPTFNFQKPTDAIQHILNEEPCRWVIKQNAHDSSICYVGQLADSSDVLELLHSYNENGIRGISLQKVAEGVEFAVGRYFNGSDWVGPIQLNIEHKPLCEGDIGPLTGEMGSLVWFSADEQQALFITVLEPLRSHLESIDFRGNIDVNCIVSAGRVTPIEITARLGSPAVHIHDSLFLTSWREILGSVADRRKIEMKYREGYGVVVTMAIPPFPYRGSIDSRYSARGYPVLFSGLQSEEARAFHYHFESVQRAPSLKGQQILKITDGLGCAVYVTGVGATVQAAREDAYRAVDNICIPKSVYRRDIGEKFILGDEEKLKEWGLI